MTTNTKSVHFNCSKTLVDKLDGYTSRYVCRTQLIEAALQQYVGRLHKNSSHHSKPIKSRKSDEMPMIPRSSDDFDWEDRLR